MSSMQLPVHEEGYGSVVELIDRQMSPERPSMQERSLVVSGKGMAASVVQPAKAQRSR